MIPQHLIELKRDGNELTAAQLGSFLAAYEGNAVAEEQMAAFLMAVYFNGLSPSELRVLTDSMLHSGRVLDLTHLPGPRVDKHSTGGVGDKVSLVLAPLAAEMGMFVPMMSGRGLGHTGGTLDKLESIEGFQTRISLERFVGILESVGCAMIGQTEEIAPLDRRLYALRDVTGTVSSIPLISASIMSKKLAEGLSGLVLDVKVGAGAFLPELADATELAGTMVAVGEERGLPVTAVLSTMDRPLGVAVGNGLEVVEAVACLRGGGPQDLRGLTLRLAAEMALVGGLTVELEEGLRAAERALDGGGALERFGRLVEAQGGPVGIGDGRYEPASAPFIKEFLAESSGVVTSVDPKGLGYGLIRLGGGRTRQEQRIDPRVGFQVLVRPGEKVEAGQPVALVHCAAEDDFIAGAAAVRDALKIGMDQPHTGLPLVIDRVPALRNQETKSL